MMAVLIEQRRFREAFKQATFDVNKAMHEAAGKDGAPTKNESKRALDQIHSVIDKLRERIEEGAPD